MEKDLYQPNRLAKTCGIKRNTLNGYLKDAELFPPASVDEDNGYRYYDESTISKLNLLRHLKKRPYRLRFTEIKPILKKEDIQVLYKLYKQSKDLKESKASKESKTSKDPLFDYLRQNGYLSD